MDKGATMTQIVDATNRFYTLIPHDFGLKKPPLLDKPDIIKVTSLKANNGKFNKFGYIQLPIYIPSDLSVNDLLQNFTYDF